MATLWSPISAISYKLVISITIDSLASDSIYAYAFTIEFFSFVSGALGSGFGTDFICREDKMRSV